MPEAPVIPQPSLVNTPPPAPTPAPEATLFPETPTGAPAPGVATPPPAAPVTPPVASPEPKAPTEPPKPEVPATPAPAPAEYDLKLPENSLLSADDLATITKEAKAAGLSKEQAENVLKTQNQIMATSADRAKVQADKTLADAKVLWRSQIEKDPILGGEHIAETALLSSRGYNALATPEDKKFIEQLGLDHTPSFVRMMAKVGKLIGEDPRLILGNLGPAPVSRDPAAVLYGKTTPDGTGKIPG